MSRPVWLSATAEHLGKVLDFPVRQITDTPPPALPGLAASSPENLIIEATHILERVVRLAASLDENQRSSVLGHLITLETEILDPLQAWVERHRSFLSDLSARQARKRRRRQRRVHQKISA